jgi:hypothetical protein
LEVEKGHQQYGRLKEKLTRYVSHWYKTRERFTVLVTVQTGEEIDRLNSLFDELNLPSNYLAVLESDLINSPSTVLSKHVPHD